MTNTGTHIVALYCRTKQTMGTVRRHKTNTTPRVHTSSPLKAKGDRLGWVSLEEVETVDLKQVLTKGKVVRLSKSNRPLLVP